MSSNKSSKTNKKSHKEWKKENSLTSPIDRNLEQKFRLDQGTPALTEEQISLALNELTDSSLVKKYPEIERRYLDPPLDNQKIFLLSFVPAKGATPNEEGFYGFAKMRGSFATDHEANERAEMLIRTTDSYHTIFHGLVGRPFPLTLSTDFSQDHNRVELRKQMKEAISEDVKKKRQDEQREIQEIKDREKELLADVQQKPEDNHEDHYTTLKVKKAQLSWTYLETEKKLQQMVGSIAKTQRELEELDQKDPELKNVYFKKYMDAREQAGLSTDKITAGDSFMKYLVEDVSIDAVEREYERLFGKKET